MAAHQQTAQNSTLRGHKSTDDSKTSPRTEFREMRNAIREVTDAFHHVTTELQASVNELRGKLERISAAQLSFVEKMEEVKQHFITVGKQTGKNAALIRSLSDSEGELRTSMKAATRKLNRIEQMNVDCDVLISNVEKRDNEDTNQIATNMTTLLDVPAIIPKIDSCYRLRSVNVNHISPIVVRFSDQRAKQNFVAAAQKRRIYNDQLGGSSRRRVFVNHRLTNAFQEIDKITRKRGVRCGYKAWYANGSFFLRSERELSPIEVQSTDDLPLDLTTEES